MFGIDCHTHSGNSPDGTGTVGGLCRRDISLGWEICQRNLKSAIWRNPARNF